MSWAKWCSFGARVNGVGRYLYLFNIYVYLTWLMSKRDLFPLTRGAEKFNKVIRNRHMQMSLYHPAIEHFLAWWRRVLNIRAIAGVRTVYSNEGAAKIELILLHFFLAYYRPYACIQRGQYRVLHTRKCYICHKMYTPTK